MSKESEKITALTKRVEKLERLSVGMRGAIIGLSILLISQILAFWAMRYGS